MQMLRLLVPGLLNKQQEAKEAGVDGENCWKRGSRDEKRIVGGEHCRPLYELWLLCRVK